MNDTAIVKARAKINIILDVVGKRDNGYHDIRTVMQTLDLHDIVTVRRLREKDGSNSGISLITNSDKIPKDNTNLAYRAAECMKKRYSLGDGIEIQIDKNIPVAAGLAGGSADCAAVILGIKDVFNLNISEGILSEIAAALGADVPYCLKGGTFLAEGIGEKLTKLSSFPFMYVLVVKPDISVSTPWVYKNFDSVGKKEFPNVDRMIDCISNSNINGICESVCNVLESVTVFKYPIIDDIKRSMIDKGALTAMMSGSGPSVFGLYRDRDTCAGASEYISGKFGFEECFVTEISNEFL